MAKNRNRSRETVTETFHDLLPLTAVSGAFTAQSVTPGLFSRGATVQDAWDEYKLLSLRYRIHTTTSGLATQVTGFAFYPGVTTTVPVAGAQIWSNDQVVTMMIGQSMPTNWHSVPKSLLAGQQPWYKVLGSTSSPDQIPGQLCGALRVSGSDSVALEIHATFQFRGQAAASNTPQAVELRSKLAELRQVEIVAKTREQMLAVLGLTSSMLLPPASALRK